jgi:hypothetical protein
MKTYSWRKLIGIWIAISMISNLMQGNIPKPVRWQPFEYIARNIFVRCLVEGPNGTAAEGDFIIDTGMNRSSLSPALARRLSLPDAGTKNSHAPGGSKVTPLALLRRIALGGVAQTDLTVTVEQMAEDATRLYGHNVDGFLGADFFEARVLSLNFPKRIFSIDLDATLDGSEVLNLDAVPFSGLLLVPVTLPNKLTMLAIIDTGADDDSDFVFYEDALYGLDFRITDMSTSNDATGESQPVLFGSIGPIRLGDLNIPAPIITRRAKALVNPYGTRYRPGLITCRFLERYLVQIDFPHHRLRLAS